MLLVRSSHAPFRRPLRQLASWCLAGTLLISSACQGNLAMQQLSPNSPLVASTLSSTAPSSLPLLVPLEYEKKVKSLPGVVLRDSNHNANSCCVRQTSLEIKQENSPAAQTFGVPHELSAPLVSARVAVNLQSVLQLTFERNAEILISRERVKESVIALDAALRACAPEVLRKDTFKKALAETRVCQRRFELRRVENDHLQDAANTYFDWLTAMRGEMVARELLRFETKLLDRARRLAEVETPTRVLVNSTQTAINGRQQYISQTHQQAEGAAAKLAYLMAINSALLGTSEGLKPTDRVDSSHSVEVLVRQAQENGPGVVELLGVIASIENGLEQAIRARCICEHTGAQLVCGRLLMAQSQLQQAQLSLINVKGKLRASVEEAVSAILNGREQITSAAETIQNASETYRLLDSQLTEESVRTTLQKNTHNAVLTSIEQLSQAYANYLKSVNSYNKAQVRLLLLLGTNTYCTAHAR